MSVHKQWEGKSMDLGKVNPEYREVVREYTRLRTRLLKTLNEELSHAINIGNANRVLEILRQKQEIPPAQKIVYKHNREEYQTVEQVLNRLHELFTFLPEVERIID